MDMKKRRDMQLAYIADGDLLAEQSKHWGQTPLKDVGDLKDFQMGIFFRKKLTQK